MISVKLIGIVCFVSVVCALPAQEEARSLHNNVQTENDLLESVHADCLQSNTMACLKYKIYNFVDKALQKESVTVMDGLEIVKTGSDNQEGAPRSLTTDDTIETVIMNRIKRFIDTHTIKYEIKGSDVANSVGSAARSIGSVYDSFFEDDSPVEEGRGKKKKVKKVVKVLGPLLPLVALKSAMLFKLATAGVALIAGKAFLVAKIALLLAVLNGIGKLLGSGGGGGGDGGHNVEVVQAHHAGGHDGGYHDFGGHGGHGGHGGWARNIQAQQLAYSGHEQANQHAINY